MLFIARNRNAPVEGGAGDGQVLQAGLYEADHFIAALGGTDEVRLALIEGEKLLLIGGKPEEVAFLLHPFHRRALRAVAHIIVANFRFFLAVVGLVAYRVPAGIAALVDVATSGHGLPDRL